MFAGGVAQAVAAVRLPLVGAAAVGGAWGATHHFLKSRRDLARAAVRRGRRAATPRRLRVQAHRRVAGGEGGAPVRARRLGRRRLRVAAPAAARPFVGRAPDGLARHRAVAIVIVTVANALFFWSLAPRRDAGHRRRCRWWCSRRPRSARARWRSASSTGGCARARSRCRWCSAWPTGWGRPVRCRRAPATRPGMPAHEIRFEDVRFALSDQCTAVLDGFDLTIPAGTSLAIVGQNGAGKTTLAKLLCRMYDPTEGAIERRRRRPARVRPRRRGASRIAAVFQDFVRYELTLRDNVAPAGAPDETFAPRSTRRAPTSWPTSTRCCRAPTTGGTDLSGGQWQRVALARACARCGSAPAWSSSTSRPRSSTCGARSRSSTGCSTRRAAARRSSSRTASRPCATPTASACSKPGGSSSSARTTS